MQRHTVNILLALAFGTAFGWAAARGLPGNATDRLTALEAGQKEILQALRGGAAPAAAAQVLQPSAPVPDPMALPAEPLTVAGSAAIGRDNAPVTMIEFSDFQCPFCARHVRDTFEQIKKDYVDTGKVRYVFRHYPIESLHPQAWAASRTAECASRQGKFWNLHTTLFANQKQLGDADLARYARAAGVEMAEYQRCVTDPAVTAKIKQDLDEGARAGVSGTPMFFVGKTDEGKVRALKRVNGAAAYSAFQQAIDSLLSGS